MATLSRKTLKYASAFGTAIMIILGAIIFNNGGTHEWQLWLFAGAASAPACFLYVLVERGFTLSIMNEMIFNPVFKDLPGNIWHEDNN